MRYFPAPKFLQMPAVGIEISLFNVRLMEIIDHASLRVGSYSEQALSEPFSFSEGDQNEVKEILKKWKKDYGLQYIKASLPEEKAYLFRIEIKYGKDREMREAIEFNLEENVPINGAEALFDYRLIGEGSKPGFVKVAVTVFPREIVERALAFFHECGLTPISFLMDASALSRALIKREDLGTYLVVNMRGSKTGISIVSRGSVRFASTISVGGGDFIKALVKQCSITSEEAIELTKTKGFIKTVDNEALFALRSIAAVFKEEIQKVCVYWQSHRDKDDASEAIQKILLAGKDALILGFREYLSQNVNIETEIGNMWSNLGNFDKYLPPLSMEEALDFGVTIGLALPENE